MGNNNVRPVKVGGTVVSGVELPAFSRGTSYMPGALFETKISKWNVGFRRQGVLPVFIVWLIIFGVGLVLRVCGSPVGCLPQIGGHLLQSRHLTQCQGLCFGGVWGVGEGDSFTWDETHLKLLNR